MRASAAWHLGDHRHSSTVQSVMAQVNVNVLHTCFICRRSKAVMWTGLVALVGQWSLFYWLTW